VDLTGIGFEDVNWITEQF